MAFSVFVGGYRHVGTYATHEEAKQKANTCISTVIDIVETDLPIDTPAPNKPK